MNGRETVEYQWDEYQSATTAIVETVADTTGRDPLDMPPLYEYVETDALDDLVTPESSESDRSVHVTFSYENHVVHVEGTETIEVSIETI